MTIIYLLLILTAAAVAICWLDTIKYTDNIPNNSITQIISRAAKKYPIIAAGVGYALGFLSSALIFHLFDSVCQ